MDFNVDEAYSGEDAYVESVSFGDLGYGSVPAVTYSSTRDGKAAYSTMSMNNDWLWDNASCEIDWGDDAADVRVVITHEAGHLIVLYHDPNFPNAVILPDGECKLYTTSDDKNGARYFYGEDDWVLRRNPGCKILTEPTDNCRL